VHLSALPNLAQHKKNDIPHNHIADLSRLVFDQDQPLIRNQEERKKKNHILNLILVDAGNNFPFAVLSACIAAHLVVWLSGGF